MPKIKHLKLAIVGLGYVGLPLAVAFAKKGVKVIGFDISREKIAALKKGVDPTGEVGENEVLLPKLIYTANPAELRRANFIIAAVPTPIDEAKQPDLTPVKKSAELIGKNLAKKTVVVYESTVYPGVTEEICGPIIEKFSGLRCGKDFWLGYSPERINPGDKEHTLEKVVKVVSGMDYRTLKRVASVYRIVCEAGVYETPNIKTAEAAKVIENIQRDLNIALVNELALIFSRIGISTSEVLKAAGTKWNFHQYQPGLVGGHCLHKNQLLFLRNTGHMKTEPIGDYVENLLNRGQVSKLIMGRSKVFVPKISIDALTFNVEQKRTELKPVLAFSSRREEKMLEITTAANQKIKVSPMHPMIIVEKGKFLVKHAKDLTLNDRLPVIFNLPEKPVEPIDIISHIDKETIKKTRVKLIHGQWRNYKNQLNIKRHTGRKASGFYLYNYLPLDVYLRLEKKGVMPVKREELLLITGRGPSCGQIKAVIQPSKNFFRLLGYYLSEGCITKDKSYRVRWSFNEDEKEYLADLRICLRELGLKWSEYDVKIDKGYQIKVSNRFLALVFKDILKLGRNCYEKAVYDEYLYAPAELRIELIKGLLRGDGDVQYKCKKKNYQKNGKHYCHRTNVATVHYFSISPKLFQQVLLMLLSLKFTFSIDKNRPLLYINGHENLKKMVEIFDGRDRQKLLDYFRNKRKYIKSQKSEQYDNYLTVEIKSIKKLPGEVVYSLETQDNKTLVTDYGLVTHNCIGVDPYYLTYLAQKLGYHPKVILAGRETNDYMAEYAAELIIKGLIEAGKIVKNSKVLIMGLTFKENINDTRNSKAKDVIKYLQSYGIEVFGHDPMLSEGEVNHFGIKNIVKLEKMSKVDAVALLVVHNQFKELTLSKIKKLLRGQGVLVDVKNYFAKENKKGIIYKTL